MTHCGFLVGEEGIGRCSVVVAAAPTTFILFSRRCRNGRTGREVLLAVVVPLTDEQKNIRSMEVVRKRLFLPFPLFTLFRCLVTVGSGWMVTAVATMSVESTANSSASRLICLSFRFCPLVIVSWVSWTTDGIETAAAVAAAVASTCPPLCCCARCLRMYS